MSPFGTAPDGQDVHKITLSNGDLTVAILTWGAIIRDVRLAGVPYNLTLGSDDLRDYLGGMRYHGAIIGPVANRIGGARATIDGYAYELERNDNDRNHLHSGSTGLHARVWTVDDHGPAHATLSCTLGDGDCGLPGNRCVTVTYRLLAPATLDIQITGTTDQPTLMNSVNHSYWNLDGSDTWAGHSLRIAAETYLPVNADTLPTGDITPVAETPFDFRTPRQITPATPYMDHNFCLSDGVVPLRDVATLTGTSGLGLTLATDQPGLQVYDGRDRGYAALALEAQLWPDAINNRRFPSFRCTPDAPFSQQTQIRLTHT